MSLAVTLGTHTVLGRQTIDATSASTALTVPTGAVYAIIATATAGARYTQQGTAASGTVGLPCAQYEKIIINTPLADVRLFGGSFEVVYFEG